MLEKALAEKLIEQVTEYTSYNVNIMDEKGVIIASRSRERVGTFHEAAYELLQGTGDMLTVMDGEEYPGSLRGMNLVIEIDGRREGVVGVTGDPDEIRPVALIIKMAIETLIKYEDQKLRAIRRQSKKERFLEMLIRERDADPDGLRRLARELDYREDAVRIPILVCLEQAESREQALEAVSAAPGHGREDLIFTTDEAHLLVFKALDVRPEDLAGGYREPVEEYLEAAGARLRQNGIRYRFCAGTLQDHFSRYAPAYRHCRWLEDHISDSWDSVQGDRDTVFFYDYVEPYLQETVPQQELAQIFQVFGSGFSGEFRKNYRELVGGLMRTDFRIADAAKKTYMHKNTFVYRYHKIRDALKLDAQNRGKNHEKKQEQNPGRERGLLTWLYIYLTRS